MTVLKVPLKADVYEKIIKAMKNNYRPILFYKK
jgi:hypothetical protein